MPSCDVCGLPAACGIAGLDYCAEHAESGIEFFTRLYAMHSNPPPDPEELEDAVAAVRATVRMMLWDRQ